MAAISRNLTIRIDCDLENPESVANMGRLASQAMITKYKCLSEIPLDILQRMEPYVDNVKYFYFHNDPLNQKMVEEIDEFYPQLERFVAIDCTLDGMPVTREEQLRALFSHNKKITIKLDHTKEDDKLVEKFQSALSLVPQPQNKRKESPTDIVTKKLNLTQKEKPPCKAFERQIKRYIKLKKVENIQDLPRDLLANIFSFLVDTQPLQLCYKTKIAHLKTEDIDFLANIHEWFDITCWEACREVKPAKVLTNTDRFITNKLQYAICKKVDTLDIRSFAAPKSAVWLQNCIRCYPNIKRLFLPAINVTAAVNQLLLNLRPLPFLDLSLCHKEELSGLEKLQLQELTLSYPYEARFNQWKSEITEQKDLDALAEKLPTHENFDIRVILQKTNKATHFKTIAQIQTLKILDLGFFASTINEKALEEIGKLHDLEELYILKSENLNRKSLSKWELPKLRTLLLTSCDKIDDAAISVISKRFPQLEELSIGSSAITDSALSHLKNLGHLSRLAIAACPQITPNGFKKLCDLSAMKKLAICFPSHFTEKALINFGKIANLEFLSLKNVMIHHDAVFKFLEQKPKCKVFLRLFGLNGEMDGFCITKKDTKDALSPYEIHKWHYRVATNGTTPILQVEHEEK